MDIEGSIDKLLNPVEKHAGLIGAGLAVLDTYKNGSLMDIIDKMTTAQVHFPDFQEFARDAMQNRGLVTAAVVGIGGYFAKDMTSNGMLKKVAGIAQNGGLGYAAAYAIMTFLWSMTHSPVYPEGNTGASRSAYRGSTLNSNPTAGGAYGKNAPSRIIGN